MHNPKIIIIIPAFNESGNIGRVIAETKALPMDVDILVINDGSRDSTVAEARAAKARVVSLPFNLGIGAAVQTGLIYAFRHKYDVAIQVDGDGQHDVGYVAKILDPVLKGQADLSIGSRFIGPFIGYRSSWIRRIGIHFFANLISFLTGCPVTDPTSGFRVYNQKTIKVFSGHYPHDFPEPEAIVLAKRAGLRILEVPVEMRKRMAGKSSIRYLKTLYYMIKVTSAIMLDLVKKKAAIDPSDLE